MELFQGLGHIAIVTKNLENSIAFYTKIGGKVLDRGEPKPGEYLALVEFGGVTLELLQIPVETGASGCVNHFAIAVADVAEAMRVLAEAGVDSFETPDVTVMPNLFGGLENCFFHGPDGERIELLKMYR